ncbi:hypothetical protein CRG98_033994 [Punica granatum]|uniref:RNase H type-1 domain-containing protein n=1 Tax=Punica granatum TaxID=22663 RepID=A0A2I0INU8_PUNGR|nr:hypothetical protein CRG98_033994 [Punica granatum]
MPPPSTYFKLNTDGSSRGKVRQVEGGLSGTQMEAGSRAFFMNLGLTTSVVAELRALRQGLILALEMGIDRICVDIDARLVFDWIWGVSSSIGLLKELIDDCKTLSRRFLNIKPSHTFREANSCVDLLAKIGGDQLEVLVVFDHVTAFLGLSLFSDSTGVSGPRGITNLYVYG